MSATVATPYNAMRLGRDVRLASRRYGPAYGLIAYPVCWLQAPRDPSEKLGLLIENLFCRAVMSVNETWRARLDRSPSNRIKGIILSAPCKVAVYPIRLSAQLLHISAPDGTAYAPLHFSDGGPPIIDRVAGLCAEFFGDENGNMSYVNTKPILDIVDASQRINAG